jgi:hypothetical protein
MRSGVFAECRGRQGTVHGDTPGVLLRILHLPEPP